MANSKQEILSEQFQHLNERSAKNGVWIGRIEACKLCTYQFQSKGETIDAKRFVCLVVGRDPTDYATAVVPFGFKNKQRPQQTYEKWSQAIDPVVVLSHISLDSKARAEYISSSGKGVILLHNPTRIQQPAPGSPESQYPASWAQPHLTLAQIIDLDTSRAVDLAFVVTEVGDIREVIARGRNMKVRDIKIIDDTGSAATLTAWGPDTCNQFESSTGQGARVFFARATLTQDDNNNNIIKLSADDETCVVLWNETPRIRALVQWYQARDPSDMVRQVTSEWQPSARPLTTTGEAWQICGQLFGHLKYHTIEGQEDILWQANDVIINVNTQEIHNEKGQRLYLTGTVRDWSLAADVNFVNDATWQVFACSSQQEVETKHKEGTLAVARHTFDVRGVRRVQDGDIRMYIAEVAPSALPFQSPSSVTRKLPQYCEYVPRNGFITTSLSCLECNPLQGLVTMINGKKASAFAFRLLVQGTKKTELLKITGNAETRILVSRGVKCLLSNEDSSIAPGVDVAQRTFTLRFYATEDELLDYKLDTRTAVVHVSAGRAGDTPNEIELTVDYLQIVDENSIADTKAALAAIMALPMSIGRGEKRPPEEAWSPLNAKARRLNQQATLSEDS